MEFRWIVRAMPTPRNLLRSATSLSSVSKSCVIRSFSNSPHLPYIPPSPPLPAITTTTNSSSTKNPPVTNTSATNAPPTRAAPDPSMADLFGLLTKPASAPKHRNFGAGPDDLNIASTTVPPLGYTATPRTGPSAGRSVSVRTDLPTSLSRLRAILSSNNVKADQVRQRFHERPGLKKKRLKSARHRKRFKAGFKKLVAIAMDMKRKGL